MNPYMLWSQRLSQKERLPIDKDAKEMWGAALKYSAIGIEMGAAIFIGYGIGWWLDKKFETKPVFTLVMLLLGIAAGFKALYRVAKEIAKNDPDKKD